MRISLKLIKVLQCIIAAMLLLPLSGAAQLNGSVFQWTFPVLEPALGMDEFAGSASGAHISPCDINGDGFTDFVRGYRTENPGIGFWINDGGAVPSFTYSGDNPYNISTVGIGERIFVSVVDYDNDGVDDLIVATQSGGIRTYRNTGSTTNPNFSTAFENLSDEMTIYGPHSADLQQFQTLEVADLNGDGLFDLLGSYVFTDVNNTHESFAIVALNQGALGSPYFPTVQTNPYGLDLSSLDVHPFYKSNIKAFDYDEDGDLDLFGMSGAACNVFYIENTGSASSPAFAPLSIQFNINAWYDSDFEPFDIDGDGNLDMLAGQETARVFSIYNVTLGCTVTGACNYDPNATDNDGSCEYTSCAGCMDVTACNYDSTATLTDGSCEFTSCAGCTDQNADNYDPTATIDDGSCFTTVLGCIDEGACNYDLTANTDDGSCEYTSCAGCTDPNASNYDATASIDDGSCLIAGCMIENASNYDPNATIEGPCTVLENCGYSGGLVVEMLKEDYANGPAATDVIIPGLIGITRAVEEGLFNSEYEVSYANDGPLGTEWHFGDINSGEPWGSWRDAVRDQGGLDIDEVPYTLSMRIPSLDLYFEFEFTSWTCCGDGGGFAYTRTFLVDESGCSEIPVVLGCTDANACNFDANANLDDDSCIAPNCSDVAACNYDADSDCINDDFCQYPDNCGNCDGSACIEGCTDASACNYNEFAASDDGSCAFDAASPFINCPEDIVVTTEPGVHQVQVFYDLPEWGGPCEFYEPFVPLEDVKLAVENNYLDWLSNLGDYYEFTYDLSGPGIIDDGGGDMYDDGNIISTNLGSQLPYTNGAIELSNIIGGSYFTMELPGLFVMAAEANGVNEFGIDGDIGADGNGVAEAYSLSSATGGFTGYYKGVCDSNDPSINQLIVIQNPSATQTIDESTEDDTHVLSNIDGVSRIYYLLWAGDDSFGAACYSETEVQGLLDSFAAVVAANPTIMSGASSGGLFSTGTNVVEYFLDADVETASCSFTVTVNTPGCKLEGAFNYDPIANIEDNSLCEVMEDCGGFVGPESVTFTKTDYADPLDAANYDLITSTVALSRGDEEGLFNAISQTSYDGGDVDNTEWHWGTYDQVLYPFTNWIDAVQQSGSGAGDAYPGVMTLHIIDEDLYFEIEFTGWTCCGDGGGFTYTRTYLPEVSACQGVPALIGCTDESASNFDASSNLDDPSLCQYGGCTDGAALNFDCTADLDDGSCQYAGCMDTAADNYNAAAVEDDGSCQYAGCTYTTASNYDATANVDDGSCVFEVLGVQGCTYFDAINYDANATIDDGSCLYEAVPVGGCTDQMADNYDSNADYDDGSCYVLENCSFEGEILVTFTKENNADWTLEANQDRITDNVWITRQNNQGIYNAFDQASYPGNAVGGPSNTEWKLGSSTEPGTYTSWVSAVQNNPAQYCNNDNVMSLHIIDLDLYFDVVWHNFTGSNGGGGFSYTRIFMPELSSCDAVLLNYGCMDDQAMNFDADANVNDPEDCFYGTCPGDFNGDGTINSGDLLVFLGVFGTNCE